MLRLAHGVSMAAEWAPGDPGQAERMLALVIDGLLLRDMPAYADNGRKVMPA